MYLILIIVLHAELYEYEFMITFVTKNSNFFIRNILIKCSVNAFSFFDFRFEVYT